MFKRILAVFCAFALAFAGIGLRLFFITQIEGEQLKATAAAQQSNKFVADRSSGAIYDRFLRRITVSEPERRALITPTASNSAALAAALPQELLERCAKGKAFTVEGELPAADGVYPFTAYSDPENYLAQHLIGYRNKDGEAVCGLLKSYDQLLKNGAGALSVRYNAAASGRILSGGPVKITDDRREYGLVLTLDRDIQQIVEEEMAKGLVGAVAVSEIASGELLAVCSRPSYDMNNVANYLSSTGGELINRALMLYDAGSVFKIVVLAAYLETRGELPSLEVFCGGEKNIFGTAFHCHKKGGHGLQNVEDALANSCNLYFYELAKEVGAETILQTASDLGLGDSRYLADGVTARGAALPERDEVTTPMALANLAIGQGGVMFTVLDCESLINTIASGGVYRELKLISGVYRNEQLVSTDPSNERRALSENTAAELRRLLVFAVENGTGKTAKPENGGSGGKTASAETGQKKDGKEVVHGWFCGFFPAEQPKYSVTVFAENGLSGAASCSPVFKRIADRVNDLC